MSEISDTAYISANPHSKTVLLNRLKENWKSGTDTHVNRLQRYGKWDFVKKSDLGRYEALWKYSDSNYKYCPPRYVTDRGITVSREFDFDRIILHYMPPHAPYPDKMIPENSALNNYNGDAFSYLKSTGDKETVFETYLNSLRWVLDEVKIIVNNTTHDNVAITSDHGEAFGEFGVFYHHAGSLHPQIRQVPLAITSAKDKESYQPSFSPEDELTITENSVEASLEALGYL